MSERKTRPEAKAARRIVVKVGSGVLTRAGTLRPGVVTRLAAEVAALLDAGRQVVVVSSGAIAMGSRILGWDQLDRKQRGAVQRRFEQQIFPVLTPLAFDPGRPFPHISSIGKRCVVRNSVTYAGSH